MAKGILTLALILAVVVAVVWSLVYYVGLQASLIWTGVIGAIAWAIQTAVQQKQDYRRLLADQKRQQHCKQDGQCSATGLVELAMPWRRRRMAFGLPRGLKT